jgi:hypothetical protein|tara:strand:- start:4632 stop:5543 length:912 start_codon:yes stop_codon:yes gene_type:complete
MSRQSYSANQYSGGRTSSKSSTSSSTSSVGGGGGGRDYSPSSTMPSAPPGGGATSLGSGRDYSPPSVPFSNNDDNDSNFIAEDSYFTPTNEKTIGEKIVDFVKGGGIIGAALRGIGGLLGMESSNQYEGITGEDGYGEGDYISTLDDFAESRGLGNDYSSLDLEDQRFIEKQAYDAGYRSPAFEKLYRGGDTSQQNLSQLSSSERDAVNQVIPDLSYGIAGIAPQPSMVNKYFANMNMSGQSPLSSQLETDYNAAKQRVNNLLNITPVSQQFGYSADPYGGLLASNLQTNPFNIEYLRTRGLI